MLSLSSSDTPFRLIGDGYALAGDPSWSANGREIVFMHFDRDLNNYQIYRLALDDPGEVRNLTELYSGNAKYPDWTAASRQVAFACQEGGGADAVWHLCLTPDDRSNVTYLLEDLHRGPERDDDRLVVAHAITPTWSPDGQAIAYASDVDGDWDIYVYELAGGSVRNLTATWPSDEMHPTWRK
jgi:Tol biopolymer transport system component